MHDVKAGTMAATTPSSMATTSPGALVKKLTPEWQRLPDSRGLPHEKPVTVGFCAAASVKASNTAAASMMFSTLVERRVRGQHCFGRATTSATTELLLAEHKWCARRTGHRNVGKHGVGQRRDVVPHGALPRDGAAVLKRVVL